ncbi:unnamed protein product [Auanema sp. JU1783]|nr:unnamed protein product [Auanema sp. JU1783]
MIDRRKWALLYIFCILFNDIVAVHYWRISENGKEIEAVEDSPYSIIYPGSLLDFLDQFDNMNVLGEASNELKSTMKEIDKREEDDEPDLEERIRNDDPNCRSIDPKTLNDYSFRTTYTAESCPEFHISSIISVKEKLKNGRYEEEDDDPVCSHFHPILSFSDTDMDSVGSIEDMDEYLKYRQLVKIYWFYLAPKGADMNKFPNLLRYLLRHPDENISHNPYIHMAAAAYWRLVRDFKNAFHCYQSAAYYMHTNEDSNKYLPGLFIYIQLSMANILHKAFLTTDAAQFMERIYSSRDLLGTSSCFQSLLFSATGDIAMNLEKGYHTLLFPNRDGDNHKISLQFYNKAIEVQKDALFEEVPIHWPSIIKNVEFKISYIKCMFALSSNLEYQKSNLEKLVKNKRHFNQIYENLRTMEGAVGKKTIRTEDRILLKASYEIAKYGINPYSECFQTIAKRFVFSNNPHDVTAIIVCTVTDFKLYEETLKVKRKDSIKHRPALNDSNWRVVELFARDKSFERKIRQLKENPENIASITSRQSPKTNILHSIRNRYWRRADWPSSIDCQVIVSRSDMYDRASFPQINLSFKNQDIEIEDYLTTFIGLSFNDEHPLPWEEPFCDEVDSTNHPLSTFKGVVEMLDMHLSKPEHSESKLKTSFVRLAGRIMEDIEVAQRIRTLLYTNVGTKWIALNLAGTYWRIKGNPRQTALCLMQAVSEQPDWSDFALTQLAQSLYTSTGRRDEAIHMLDMADGISRNQPLIPWLQGRLHLLRSEVDDAVRRFKEALDRNPSDQKIAEDLLKVACSGKWSKPAISSRFPTVCCSTYVHNAVCFRNYDYEEQCFVVDPETQSLVHHRCNGIYTGLSYKPPPYAYIIAPYLPIFSTVSKNDFPLFEEDTGGVQTVETKELPLDYGGSAAFFLKPPPFWWTSTLNEVRYEGQREAEVDSWELEAESDLAAIPPKPLSFLWVRDKKEMLKWDLKLPNVLPAPLPHQIRKGLSRFPPPRKTLNMCNGVNKLSVLLENLSTWVSVTAKGEDIEKYVDLRGPIPSIAGLQPVCPKIGEANSSPILGLDHLPAFSLSDQFLFYKPEKMLTEALKSLGNERDSIEHVAARLHTAMLAEGLGQKGNVNWLLCVLSSLYWRVVGDAPRAVGCLRCALQTAPNHMRDVVLVSLANICHQAGLLNSALITAGAALSASPNLVAIHFTIANIYASIGDYQKALEFYYSTLSLQGNFEPAKERIRAIYCHFDDSFVFQGI